MSILRLQVLSLYRRAIFLSKTWQAVDPTKTDYERQYIKNEARTLFRKNKNITDQGLIKEHMNEAEARIEIALHYKTPYPRPVNLPQTILPSVSKKKSSKKQEEMKKLSTPIYLKSYEKE